MADEQDRKTPKTSRAKDADTETLSGATSAPRIIEDVDEPASSEPAPEALPDSPPASAPEVPHAAETMVFVAEPASSEPAPEALPDSPPASAPEVPHAAETMVFVAETPEARPDPTDHVPPDEVVTRVAVPDSVAPAADPAAKSSIASMPAALPSASLQPILLERIEPSLGRGERIRLDVRQLRVTLGRAESNDIRLYTAGASREHASIAGNEAGEWVASPAPGKSILIDGSPTTTPVILETGMNLVFGGDHLRCVTESVDRSEAVAPTAVEGPELVDSNARGIGIVWWAIGLATVLGVGLIVSYYWLGG